MGHLKDIANQPTIQSFPGATYEIAGDVPAAQCTEAAVEGDNGTTNSAGFFLNDFGAFAGWNLAGKIAHIITNPGGNTGDFFIGGNTSHLCVLTADPGDGGPTEYFVTDGGALLLTRNIQSFAQYISQAGYAYTIKGGKLHTNCPTATLQRACTILFDPLT